ncbi:MAG: four helix bundle protein [Hyphomonadaceae bacterium]|nr:four helix bundle protein [Hyphomonadaceae bacterium]
MAVTNYRQLTVWSKAMDVAQEIYRVGRLMPKQEEYRLTSQLIRAAISIPANIAEGHTRATRKDYAHFISISRGSAAELETLVLLAERSALLPPGETRPLLASIEEIGRMLTALHARLKSPSP